MSLHELCPIYYEASADSGSGRIPTKIARGIETIPDPNDDFIRFAITLVNADKSLSAEILAKAAVQYPIIDIPTTTEELSSLLGTSKEILEERVREFRSCMVKLNPANPKEDPTISRQRQENTLMTMILFDALVYQKADEVTMQEYLEKKFSKKFVRQVLDYYSWQTLDHISLKLHGYPKDKLQALLTKHFKDTRHRACGRRYPNTLTLPPDAAQELIQIVNTKKAANMMKMRLYASERKMPISTEPPTPLSLSFLDTIAHHSRLSHKKYIEDIARRAQLIKPSRDIRSMTLQNFAKKCGISVALLKFRMNTLRSALGNGFSQIDGLNLSSTLTHTSLISPLTVTFLTLDLAYSGFRSKKLARMVKKHFPREIGDISGYHQWLTTKQLGTKFQKEMSSHPRYQSYTLGAWDTAIEQARKSFIVQKQLRFGYSWTNYPNQRSHTFDPETEKIFQQRVLQKLLNPDSRRQAQKNTTQARTQYDYENLPKHLVFDALIALRARPGYSNFREREKIEAFIECLRAKTGKSISQSEANTLFDAAILGVDTRSPNMNRWTD
jgi:hypothetical protein